MAFRGVPESVKSVFMMFFWDGVDGFHQLVPQS